jgi:hypothetical protein
MQMDFVTTTEHLGELWHNDRQQLRERGFAMEESIATGIAEKKHIHQKYMQLFFQLPIIQVTVCSNHREWHLARRTSFTSKQTYSQIAILRKRFVDLDNEDVRRVMKFMYKKTYSFTGRFTFARFTCSDQWHYPARQQCYTNSTSSGDSITQPIPSHSIVQFDPNVHNSCSNLSFEDAEDTITTGGDD